MPIKKDWRQAEMERWRRFAFGDKKKRKPCPLQNKSENTFSAVSVVYLCRFYDLVTCSKEVCPFNHWREYK